MVVTEKSEELRVLDDVVPGEAGTELAIGLVLGAGNLSKIA